MTLAWHPPADAWKLVQQCNLARCDSESEVLQTSITAIRKSLAHVER